MLHGATVRRGGWTRAHTPSVSALVFGGDVQMGRRYRRIRTHTVPTDGPGGVVVRCHCRPGLQSVVVNAPAARSRSCSRAACNRPAVATLTYVYADQTVVLGPLATYAEPHTYDLCAEHTTRMTAPRGWDVVRLEIDLTEPEPTHDDLLALADAVRAAGRPVEPEPVRPAARRAPIDQVPQDLLPGRTRRGHLRLLPDE